MHEQARKIVHLIFGVGIAALVFFLPRDLVISILAASIFAGFVLVEAVLRGYRLPLVSRLLRDLEREGEYPGKGAFFFTASSLFCTIFFPAGVVVPSVLSLAVLDGAATLIGMRWGRHRIGNGKSFEGTAGGIIINAAALLVLLPPLQSLAASVVAGAVELVSPVDDNLTIPVCLCIVLTVTGI